MRFLLFLVYSFFYLVGLGSLISNILGVSPFVCFSFQTNEIFLNPFEDWITLFNRFKFGSWAVDSGHNFLIFLCFILFFPTWILLWFLLRRIKFSKHFKIFFTPKAIHQSSSPTPVKNAFERPKAMPKSLNFGMQIPEELEEKTSTSSTAPEEETTQSSPEDTNILTAETKEKIRAIGAKYGFDMFENVRLDKYLVPLVLATDTKALLLTFLTENREWIADEEIAENSSEPTWFSAEGLIVSPVYDMMQAAIILHEKEPTSESIPVAVLLNGAILNADTMQASWESLNEHVVCFGEKFQNTNLPSLEDLLSKQADQSTETQE